MKKTYKTLTGAYTAAQNAGARAFGSDYYAYASRVDEILTNTYKSKNALILAKCNLFKFDKKLCALEFTKANGYKWTVVGHFDSDGLLYPVAGASEVEHDKVIKPRAPKPRHTSKNKGIFAKVCGTTKSERNKSAHALILGTGVKAGTDEYKSLWSQWTEVR